eukprot:Gb_28344 [translate_table: standard]
MSKMWSRNSENRPQLLNLKHLHSSNAPAQAASKRSSERTDCKSENSVLDIRSPSPTSTLCCSFGGPTDGGVFRENVCDGQLLECLGVMDSKDGCGWQFHNINGNGDEFHVAQTENANVNVSLAMEDLANMLCQSPGAETNNSSQIPFLMGETEYPLQEIKHEGSGLQQTEFSESMEAHFSDFFCSNTEVNPFGFLSNLGDTAGHTLSPFALNTSCTPVAPPGSALISPDILGSNLVPHPFNPDFSPFKIPMDEKQPPLPLPYRASQSLSEKNVFFRMPAVPPGNMGVPHQGVPEFQKSFQWQQQEAQPGWKTLIHRRFKDPLLSTVKKEWSSLTPRGKVCSDEVQDLAMLPQLLDAAKHVEIGHLKMAQAILARLNQYLSPHGKPLQRAAFYFKEALGDHLSLQRPHTNPYPSPLELVQKISACKNFLENSHVPQFANFTANQTILETLEGEDNIHIIDFEMGLGGQWASFLQEIASRPGGPPTLRLTAVGFESMEMHLTRENLCSFAENLNVPFEFQLVEIPQNEYLTLPMLQLKKEEAIAVNYSLGMQELLPKDSINSLLHLIKQLQPKIVVVVDNESELNAALFAQRFLEALHFYAHLFESLEALSMNIDVIEMIEKFVLAPKICNVVEAAYKRQMEGEKLPHWRSMFMAAGFSPMILSNFTHTQAECLIRRRLQGFGFGFEVVKKQQEQTLLLGWQGRPLVSVSVWRC